MSKQQKEATNVVPFSRDHVEDVTPPESWRLKLELDHGRSKAEYFQKADANTPLVRIVDVLTDFAERHSLPAGAALNQFLSAVDAELLGQVFWLKTHDYAELVGADHMYGELTVSQAANKTQEMANYADEMGWHKYDVKGVVFKGLTPVEALNKHIVEYGPQVSDESLYAVSHSTARKLWGWGRDKQMVQSGVVAVDDVKDSEVTKPKKKVRYDWEGDNTLYAKLSNDFNQANGYSVKARMEKVAKDWGLSVASVKKQLNAGKNFQHKTVKKANSPFPS